MICAQCGRENTDADKFCEQCGAPLEGSALNSTFGSVATTSSALVLMGSDVEKSYRLGARAVIGRLESCEIPIDDRSISREHARLSRLRDGYVIEDLGSTTGTLVNGKRIDEAVLLRSGDVVTAGSIDLRFETAAVPQAEHNGSSDPTLVAAGVGVFHEESSPEARHGGEEEVALEVPAVPMGFPSLEALTRTPESDESVEMSEHHGSLDDADVDQLQAEKETDESSQEDALSSVPFPVLESPASVLPGHSSRSSTDIGDQAFNAVQSLVAHAADASTKLQEVEAARSQLWRELVEAQKVERQHGAVKETLRGVPDASLSADDLESTRTMVENLVANPRDVEVLMKFGQQGASLAALVDEYAQLRDIVSHLAQQALED